MTIPTSIELEIVTPEKPIVHDTVDEVQLPGWDGALGVRPGHAPTLAGTGGAVGLPAPLRASPVGGGT